MVIPTSRLRYRRPDTRQAVLRGRRLASSAVVDRGPGPYSSAVQVAATPSGSSSAAARVLSLLCAFLLSTTTIAQEWRPVAGHLATRWAKEVTPQNVWPEYPRPSMRRATWQSLNGLWDYAITAGDAAMPERPDGQILVPFAVESSLSGVGRPLRPDQRLWYRRTFTVPKASQWQGKHGLLHFDAVDWEAEVWVDGARIGEHRGGYDRFTFDLGAALAPEQPHTLLVGVRDPSDAGPQPRGKQVQKPNGIWYTPCSGIWQTVWVEPVDACHVRAIHVDSDRKRGTVRIRVDTAGDGAGLRCSVVVRAEAKDVARREVGVGEPIEFTLPQARPWSPADPFCYAFSVQLLRGAPALREVEVVDAVIGSFALRDLAVGADANGTTRLLLNGDSLFQYGPLDQGFWPDGIYTPPSYTAMCADLDAIQRMGCNMLRKHVKVESELFYDECDKRGILVWQDMPSGDCQKDPAGFERELRAMIETHRRHPSIAMWVVFNEGWGQHDTQRYVDLVRGLDPTRWIGNASGWTDQRCGDVIDVHVYPGPGMAPPEPQRASVLGEFGGLGLPLAGHTWVGKDNWGYVSFPDQETLTRAYLERIEALHPLIAQGLSAAVYTQTTDVEIEVNGWLTYDREVPKIDPVRAAAAARKLYEPHGSLQIVVPTAQHEGQPWRWTVTTPADGWQQPAFDDAKWREGTSGFGTEGTPGARVGTKWDGPQIWLRRTFEVDPAQLVDPHWFLHHDEDVEVWLNGVSVLQHDGYTTGYVVERLTAAARAALQQGRNVLAVTCKQTRGGQYIDVGLGNLVPPATPAVEAGQRK